MAHIALDRENRDAIYDRLFTESNLGRIVRLSPNWISNGFWAMKYRDFGIPTLDRDTVIQIIAGYGDIEEGFNVIEIPDSQLTKLFPTEPLQLWKPTDWIHDDRNVQGRAYISDDGSQWAKINDDFLPYGPYVTSLWGYNPLKMFFDECDPKEASFLVMPIRVAKGTKFPRVKRLPITAPAVGE